MKMQAVSNRFLAAYCLQLVDVLDKESTFNFKYVTPFISGIKSSLIMLHSWCLRALAMGPLGWDVWLLREALQGIGYVSCTLSRPSRTVLTNVFSTTEKILTEIILARPMSEIRLLMNAYQHFTKRNLVQDVQNDLSMKTKRSQFSPRI